MISEVDKHRSSTIQVVGFALMTPFGNLVVNVLGPDLFKFGILFLLFYILLALLFFCCGMICLVRSQEILEEGENR